MWKTASASSPSGGRPRLVAYHTHKEPCTKIARAGTCSFYPSHSRGVRFYYGIVAVVVVAVVENGGLARALTGLAIFIAVFVAVLALVDGLGGSPSFALGKAPPPTLSRNGDSRGGASTLSTTPQRRAIAGMEPPPTHNDRWFAVGVCARERSLRRGGRLGAVGRSRVGARHGRPGAGDGGRGMTDSSERAFVSKV